MNVQVFPLAKHEDERGWFAELARGSRLPKAIRQANLAWSRKGVIRGLHFHERGQDDLFVCLQGMVRVVVLDRETGETFCRDIGERNPEAVTNTTTTSCSVAGIAASSISFIISRLPANLKSCSKSLAMSR